MLSWRAVVPSGLRPFRTTGFLERAMNHLKFDFKPWCRFLGFSVLVMGLLTNSARGQSCDNWVYREIPSPSQRWGTCLSHDNDRGVTTLFGGYAFDGRNNQTWEWNGIIWLQRTPVNSPSPRFVHTMAFDSVRHVTVLFGGVDITNSYSAETWEWNGTNWARRFPANSPSSRGYHAMTFDSVRARTVLFGGYRDGFGYNGETWEWDGTNWALRPAPTSPSPRYDARMAYDSVRGMCVLFGGYFSGTYFSDTWEWSGASWVLRTPANVPAPRSSHAMAFDQIRGETLLFGGTNGARLNDTWVWDGNDWSLRSPPDVPSPRAWHGMVFEPARKSLVLFGGSGSVSTYLGDTWTLLNNKIPSIIKAPVNQSTCPGDGVSFHVAASGTPPLHYQWRRRGVYLTDGPRITGAGSSSLVMSSVVDLGPYDVVISNSCGSIMSPPVLVEFCTNAVPVE